MSLLGMSRSQVQSVIKQKGKPTRENLDSALRRLGSSLEDEIDEAAKRRIMIQRAADSFRAARAARSEPISRLPLPAAECDEVTYGKILPFESFLEQERWDEAIRQIQDSGLSPLEAIAAADWAFGRMLLEGFRIKTMTAIMRFGDIETIDLDDPVESPQAKVGTILRLYSGFRGAPDRVEVARRAGLPKKTCQKDIADLIEYVGLEANDFEPIVKPLPLLLLKSAGTRTFVTECLTQLSSRSEGEQNDAN